MDKNMQALLKAAQDLVIQCEEHDRPKIYASKHKACKFRDGWADEFDLSWYDTPLSDSNGFSAHLHYPGIAIGNVHLREKQHPADAKFLTKESFEQEFVPALEGWFTERIAADEYGGMYGGEFRISLYFDLSSPQDEYGKAKCFRGDARIRNERKLDAAREAVKQLIVSKEYVGADLDSPEYDACVKSISETACTFLDELGIDTLKEFIDGMLENAKKSMFDSTAGGVVQGMSAWAHHQLFIQSQFSDTELDFLCFIGLRALMYATDKYEYQSGTDILKDTARAGSKLAKDIQKFGTGRIGKQYTHYKDSKVECIANDVKNTVEIKLKEESAEVYLAAVNFLTALLKQGFPSEYQIKCNTKVHKYVDPMLTASKTNNFFANAAAYPQVWDALKDYARTAFDETSYYSDAHEEQAVMCGGYAAMALAFADPVKNFDIGLEFLEHSDFEHIITSRYFAQDFADLCKGENKKVIARFLKEF